VMCDIGCFVFCMAGFTAAQEVRMFN
jgi:hypothetical protein